jgi:hypothetical protein
MGIGGGGVLTGPESFLPPLLSSVGELLQLCVSAIWFVSLPHFLDEQEAHKPPETY